MDGVKESVVVSNGFRGDIDTVADAFVALLKHLAADFVTPMGLPMPGASLLHELDNRELRKLIHRAYLGSSDGNGLNLRSGIVSAGLPALSTEVLIRLHVHATAYRGTGSTELDSAQEAMCTELLLAAHSIVAASSISKAIARAYRLDGDNRYTAMRHINAPLLLAVASKAAAVIHDVRVRHDTGGPSWDDLLAELDEPSSLATAVLLSEIIT